MIKNIIILLVFVLAIVLLNRYYQQSSLNFKDDTVILKVKEKTVRLNYSAIKPTSEHFSNVNILRKELTMEKVKTYFEVATAESLYEFNSNTNHVISTLFEAKELKNVFSINGLTAMQVVLENGDLLNLFIDDNDMKEIKLFYGLSNTLFNSTIKELAGSSAVENEVVNLSEPMAKWSVKHNDIDGIIGSIDH